MLELILSLAPRLSGQQVDIWRRGTFNFGMRAVAWATTNSTVKYSGERLLCHRIDISGTSLHMKSYKQHKLGWKPEHKHNALLCKPMHLIVPINHWRSAPLFPSFLDTSHSKTRKKRSGSSHKPEFFHGEPFRPDYVYGMLPKIRSTLSYKVTAVMWPLTNHISQVRSCDHV